MRQGALETAPAPAVPPSPTAAPAPAWTVEAVERSPPAPAQAWTGPPEAAKWTANPPRLLNSNGRLCHAGEIVRRHRRGATNHGEAQDCRCCQSRLWIRHCSSLPIENTPQRQPVRQSRSFGSARDKMPQNDESLRIATANLARRRHSRARDEKFDVEVKSGMLLLPGEELLDLVAGASTDLRNAENGRHGSAERQRRRTQIRLALFEDAGYRLLAALAPGTTSSKTRGLIEPISVIAASLAKPSHTGASQRCSRALVAAIDSLCSHNTRCVTAILICERSRLFAPTAQLRRHCSAEHNDACGIE
jgi:hypothetical protein